MNKLNEIFIYSDDKAKIIGYDFKKSKVEKLEIPEGIQEIDDYALRGLEYKTLCIPKSLTKLGKYTIYDKEFSQIEVNEENSKYYTDGKALYEKNNSFIKLLKLINTEKESTIPNEVNEIEDNAIASNTIERIVLPKFLKEFDEKYINYKSENLKEIVVSENTENIIHREPSYDKYNFKYIIPESSEYLFKENGCIFKVLENNKYKLIWCEDNEITNIKLLSNTIEIGDYAFYNIENLQTVDFGKEIVSIGKSAFENTILKELILPETIKVIKNNAFSYCLFNKVELPETIEYVAPLAFKGIDFISSKIQNKKKKDVFSIEEYERLNRIDGKENINKDIISENKDDMYYYCVEDITDTLANDNMDYKKMGGFAIDIVNQKFKIYISVKSKNTENLKLDSKVNIDFLKSEWFLIDEEGNFLGELPQLFRRYLQYYLSYVDIKNIKLESIESKNVIISMDIVNKNIKYESLNDDEKYIYDNFSFIEFDDHVQLLKVFNNNEKIKIPSKINNKKVILAQYIFEDDYLARNRWDSIESPNYNKIKEIEIEEGIEELSKGVLYASKNLSYLRKIYFPTSINKIDEYVFANNDKSFYTESSDTIYYVKKDSYSNDFLNNYKTKRGYVPNLNVMVYDDDSNENKLKYNTDLLTILEQENLADGLFVKVKSWINEKQFNYKELIVPEKLSGKNIVKMSLYYIPKQIEKIFLPSTIVELEGIDSEYLLSGRFDSLKNIEISENNHTYYSDGVCIYSKDRKTLIKCLNKKIEEYSIINGTEIIGKTAFAYNDVIKKITIPSSVKELEDKTFLQCSSLEKIEGLENIQKIGNDIYGDSLHRCNVPFFMNEKLIILGDTLIQYKECNDKIVEIPTKVKRIAKKAFYAYEGNTSVEKIVLPDGIEIIEANAFEKMYNLKEINFPNSLKEIGNYAFKDCSIESIVIPESVNIIGLGAFDNTNIKNLSVNINNSNYSSKENILFNKELSRLIYAPKDIVGKALTIPENVKYISEYAFSGYKNLEKVVFTGNIDTIENGAFQYCENLKEVVFPNEVSTISTNAFSNCKISTIIWPKKLIKIDNHAFCNNNLSKLELPDTVEYIGDEAFSKTLNDKIVSLPKSVKKIGYGILSGAKEIVIYDSIDEDVKDAYEGIDEINGKPNSMVGYIGIGDARAKIDCAANHKWLNYTISVKSSVDDEIKYKVYMGADKAQRNYYCFLSSAWGKNATFAFKNLDKFFKKIKGTDIKIQIAKYRLEYPIELMEDKREEYEKYLKKYCTF